MKSEPAKHAVRAGTSTVLFTTIPSREPGTENVLYKYFVIFSQHPDTQHPDIGDEAAEY